MKPSSKATKKDALKKLEYLSLVSKVCTELDSHLGFIDKILAEFITDLGGKCLSVDEFDQKLKNNGAHLPYYFVRTLLTIIHAILPPKVRIRKPKGNIGDSREHVRGLDKEIKLEKARLRRRDDIGGENELSSRRDPNRDKYEGKRDERDRDDGKERVNRRTDDLELYQVYRGRVTRIMDHGCFVEILDVKGKEGLVLVSHIATRRVASAKDMVKRDQEVFVKVISVSTGKVSLSMRDVDQNTGKDLLPLKRSGEDVNVGSGVDNGSNKSRFGLSGIKLTTDEDVGVSFRRPLKKMSSPERWEANQLIASGVLSVKDYPMYDEETNDGMVYLEEGGDEVELNDDEPAFLKGQSHYSMDMSPVKIFKNPEVSLSREAALKSALIKERREVRNQQQRSMLDSIPKDLNRPWEDPMPENGERHLAQELRESGCQRTICLNGKRIRLVKH